MSKSEYKRIEILAEGRGEFTVMEDGYTYWFPQRGGGCSANQLRILADILDNKNRAWDEQVKTELEK